MGYVASTKAIVKVKSFLDAMLKSDVSLVWISNDPRRLAYQIREAFFSIEKLSFDKYSTLRDKFEIRVRDDKVVAERRNTKSIPEGMLSFSSAVDPIDIVQTVISHKAIDFDLYFPNASRNPTSLRLLSDWCKDNNYEFDLRDNGLVVSKIRETKRLHIGE